MTDYLNRRAPTTAEINAGITKFNNFQRKNPGKVARNISPSLYGPAVGTAPNIGMPAAPAAPAQDVLRRPRKPYESPRGLADRLGDAGNLLTAATILPAGTGLDYLRQGATYIAGGDVDSLKGGKNAIADGMKTEAFGALDRLRGDFAQSQADMRSMLGAKPVVDPAAIDMKMVEEARRRRAAAAAAPAVAGATPNAARNAAVARPAANPVVNTAPAAGGISNQGDNRKGNYWIDGNGVRRDITWDANGNITSGLRDGNDPNVRKSRQANGAAILDNTQQLYTGLNRK